MPAPTFTTMRMDCTVFASRSEPEKSVVSRSIPFSFDAFGSLVANRSAKAGRDVVSETSRIFVATTAFETSCVVSPVTASSDAKTAATTACAAPTSTQCASAQATLQVKTQAAANFHQNIDVMRSLHNAFGYASYKADAPFYY